MMFCDLIMLAWGKTDDFRYCYIGPISIWASTLKLRIKFFHWDFVIMSTEKLNDGLQSDLNMFNDLKHDYKMLMNFYTVAYQRLTKKYDN